MRNPIYHITATYIIGSKKNTMKYLITFLLLPSVIAAQSISVAPTSFKAWGKTGYYSSISASYKNIGIHYFHPYKTLYWKNENYEGNGPETTPAFAISYTPINVEDILRAGAIIFDRPFPIKIGSQINFKLSAGYSFGIVRVSYVHISNGFGIMNDVNPGMDMMQLSLNL